MKTIKDKPVYECEYCGKQFLSIRGGKIHENHYCKKNPKNQVIVNEEEIFGIPLFQVS